MPSWQSDGLVSGYDPIDQRMEKGVYHLGSPGSVDANAITRLQWDLAGGNSANPLNRLHIDVSIRFSVADRQSRPNSAMVVAAILVKASKFPEGAVPTPAQIFDKSVDASATGAHYFSPWNDGGSTAVTLDTSLYFVNGEMDPNTKYWLLVYPASAANPSGPWGKKRFNPLGGLNSNARAISFWTNRKQEAPTITGPITGSIIPPGGTVNLTFTPNDPDSVTPDDGNRYNRDLAGLQVQYSPVPTAETPNPDWYTLLWADGPGSIQYWPGADFVRGGFRTGAGKIEALEALSIPISCGLDEADAPGGYGYLEQGEWRLRIRTCDYGHPQPGRMNPFALSDTDIASVRASTEYVSENVSPWSDPVRVIIPTQVPAPIPLAPKDSLAVQEGSTVRLSWNYRNTHQPSYAQRDRWVQIRRVGDEDWSTVIAGVSSLPYADLPPVTTPLAPIEPVEIFSDPGFENGTLDGWRAVNGLSADMEKFEDPSWVASGGVVQTNVLNASQAHEGSRYLNQTPASSDGSDYFVRTFPKPPDRDRFSFSGWIWIPPEYMGSAHEVNALVALLCYDVNGDQIPVPLGKEETFQDRGFGMTESGWVRFSLPEGEVLPGTVNLAIIGYVSSMKTDGTFESAPVITKFDSNSLVMSYSFNMDAFTLEATTQYEWRVRVRDTDGVLSPWSQPARFWVVPEAVSGNTRPDPEETIDGATLGCGTHRAFIYRRGGIERVAEVKNLSLVEWGRVRDDVSTAKVVVSDWDIDCGNLLAQLQSWAYELVLYRDNGYSQERVWEGPITLLTYEEDSVTINARDVMGYVYRRILRQEMNNTGKGNGTTVVTRAAQVIQNAMAPDDPNVLAYLNPVHRSDDAMQYRSTPAYSRTAFEEVDDMAANAGLDYTAVGRAIMLWGTKHRLGTLPEFRDKDLGASPIVSEYGMSMSNRYAVSDGNGVWGAAERLNEDDEDPIYGLVEMLSSTWASDSESAEGTYSQEGLDTVRESFAEYAERSIADRYPPPVVVRIPDNTTLNPDTVVSIQQLVPGVAIPLRSTKTLRTVVATQKLDSIRVREENGTETISITLSAFSRDDAEVGGEEGAE